MRKSTWKDALTFTARVIGGAAGFGLFIIVLMFALVVLHAFIAPAP